MQIEIKKVFKHTSIYGLGNFATKGIALLLLPLFTSYLTPQDYGILQLCNILSSFILIVITLGMTSSMFRVYYNTNVPDEKRLIIDSTFTTYLIFSILLLIPLFLFSQLIGNALIPGNENSYIFRIIILGTFLEGFLNLQLAKLRAEEKSGIYATITVIRIIFYALLNVFFVAQLKRNFIGVREAILIAVFMSIIILIPFTIKKIKLRISIVLIREILQIGIPLAIGGIAIFILNLTDRYMLKYLLDPSIALAQIGLYSLGSKLASLIRLTLVAPFMLAWGSLMFSYQNNPNAKQIYAKILNYFVFIGGLYFLLISIFSKEIIQTIASQTSYYEAYKVVPILALSSFLSGIYTVFTVGIIIQRKTKYIVYSNYSAAISNIVLNLILIPKFGILGACGASLAAYLINVLLVYYFAQRSYPITYQIIKNITYIIFLVFINYLVWNYNFYLKILFFILVIIISPSFKLITYNQIFNVVKYLYKCKLVKLKIFEKKGN